METSKYAWEMRTGNRFQLWPKENEQIYLTPPTKFFPKKALRECKVVEPPRLYADILPKSGVEAAALTMHKSDYFGSRGYENHFTLQLVLKGSYHIGMGGKKFRLKRGMTFLIPPNMPWDTMAEGGDFAVLWFEIENSASWRAVFGNEPVCRESKRFEKIIFFAKLFTEELYCGHPRLSTLMNISDAAFENIRREFVNARHEDVGTERLLSRVIADLRADSTAEDIAAEIGTSLRNLNSAFFKRYGCAVPKFLLRLRMKEAARLVESGAPLGEVAEATGFSCAFSLSRAFRNFYGVSPKKIAELIPERREDLQRFSIYSELLKIVRSPSGIF